MPGGLIQLASHGREDAYFTKPANSIIWRGVFKRVSNFAIEPLPIRFRQEPKLGGTTHCVIEPLGDLLCNVIVEVTLRKQAGDFTAAYNPVEAIFDEIQLVIDGDVVDRHTSDWIYIFNQMHKQYGKAQQYMRMANFDPEFISSGQSATQTFMIPMVFSFCRHASGALPLVALRFSEIHMHFKFKEASTLGLTNDDFEIKLYGHYAYVDTEERQLIANTPYDCLIEQTHMQTFTLPENVPSDVNPKVFQAKLNFYHPIKCLYWFMKDVYGAHGRYFGDPNGIPLALTADTSNPSGLSLVSPISENLNPMYEARLMFNDQERVPYMKSQYFNHVLPYLHCVGQPVPGVGILPFGFQLEQFNPVGLCNFSTLVNAMLEVKIKRNAAGTEDPTPTSARDIGSLKQLVVIGWGYNILRVENGRGTVAFR